MPRRIADERDMFHVSGPSHLTVVNWRNTDYRSSVAASLVKGVYVLERDRQKKLQAQAYPWWEFFNFSLLGQLVDDRDSSIFGAIYEFKPPPFGYNEGAPRYVIAFRGTIIKGYSILQDLLLNLHLVKNGLHLTPRFEKGVQAVRDIVGRHGGSNVWIAGHSLGSAMALLAGKNMAMTGTFLETFLFNPPFISAKHWLRIAGGYIRKGLAKVMKSNDERQHGDDPFLALSAWIPSLFVHPDDHICSGYIDYFEHRKERGESSLNAGGQHADRFHLLPSANLTTSSRPAADFGTAHGIHQWWRPNLHLHSQTKRYLWDN